MVKWIILISGAVILGLGIYYGYFFFTEKVIQEDFPKEMQATTTVIKRGSFGKIDLVHKGSGDAFLLEDAGGRRLLRFENFQVTNGPDLYVYLTRSTAPTAKDKLGDFINLGLLKGTVGNQNYEITQDSEGYNTVVIWCQQFGVLFSFAVLK